MKICFYSPYIPDSFGGGEKHLFAMALVLAKKHQVSIALPENRFTSEEELRTLYEPFVGETLSSLRFVASPLGLSGRFLSKLWWTHQFDHLLYWTDGSLFFSVARHNHLHLQIPFTEPKTSLLERIKLMNWKYRNANSEFTKAIVEKSWNITIQSVIYPAVDTAALETTTKKEKVLLHVGRFFRQLHTKRQDVLVRMFKELLQEHPKLLAGWRLVLIGAVEDAGYVAEIKQMIGDAPISLHHNLSRNALTEWFKKASLYWHATGYEADLTTHPEQAEHFGITTVEAMAAGTIPMVFMAGGQPEILGKELSYLGWKTPAAAKQLVLDLIADETKTAKLRNEIVERAQYFDIHHFEKAVTKVVEV